MLPPMVRDRLLYHLAKWRRAPSVGTSDGYIQDRDATLATEFEFFDPSTVRGRDVLDFGCGFGNLCFHLLQYEPKSVLGVELIQPAVDRCEELRPDHPLGDRVRFALGGPNHVPVEDSSIDTMLVMDVLEHGLEPEVIFAEWRRVMRPGGQVLLCWVPFRSPYGTHRSSILPVPWPQIIFGERAIFDAAARIYEDPDYETNPWDLDEDGNKRPNPLRQWRGFKDQEHLNLLNRTDFEKLFKQAGFQINRWEPKPFRDGAARAVGKALSFVPVLEEFVTPAYIIELVSP